MATKGRPLADGTRVWRAHWRDDAGRQHNKTFLSKDDAVAWERKMRREREERALGINTAARTTELNDWIRDWWDGHVRQRPLNTRESYARAINSHISPEIGRLKMVDLTTPRIAQFRDDLLAQGWAPSQVAATLRVLSSCLGKARERGLMPAGANPCEGVTKPSYGGSKRKREPLSPEEIELIRREFMEYRASNSGAWIALRSATIVSVMAYAGLRPEEVMGLKLRAYDDAARVLEVEDVFAADHRRGDTKNHQERTVSLEGPVVEDLRLWIDVLGHSDPDGWLFPPTPDGKVTRYTHRNWTARPWKRTIQAVAAKRPDLDATVGRAEPYVLRTSFVSLLAREGRPDAEIAEEAGHSVQILQRHYKRVIKRLRRLKPVPAAEQIRRARDTVGTPSIAQALRRELLADSARPQTQVVQAGGPPASELGV